MKNVFFSKVFFNIVVVNVIQYRENSHRCDSTQRKLTRLTMYRSSQCIGALGRNDWWGGNAFELSKSNLSPC